MIGVSTLAAAILSSQPLSDLPVRRSAATAPLAVVAQARPGKVQDARPQRARVTRVERPTIPDGPPHEHLSELAHALVPVEPGRQSGAAEAPIRVANAPVERPRTTGIETLEAELSRTVVKRASDRLLLAMTEPPPQHAGATIQTP